MRTTLTLEDEIAKKLKELSHQRRVSFKTVVNETLRRGLGAQEAKNADREPFRVKPFRSEFHPGIDLARLNQLSDDLETDDDLERARGDQ